MKKYYNNILFLFILFLQSYIINAQTLQELVIPRYAIGKDASAQHSMKIPFNVRLGIFGLIPNSQYIVQLSLVILNLGGSVGAGNVWNGTSFLGPKVDTTTTITDNNGNLLFWAAIQPTGNSIFEPFGDSTLPGGNGYCYVKVKYHISGSSIFTDSMISSNYVKFLDCSQFGRTLTTNDDGAFLRANIGTNFAGKFILTYDSVLATGNPLACYRIENNFYNEMWYLQFGLPSVFRGPDTNANGIYELVTPSNDSNGVQRIDIQDSSGTVIQSFTSPNGIWGGVNTVNPPRYTVLSPETIIRNVGSEIPASFKLYQNYPNPFNPVTTIRFDIEEKGFIILKVFDALGKEISTLAQGNLSAGSYNIQFNASGISSGIYFYTLNFLNNEGNHFISAKKLVVIK